MRLPQQLSSDSISALSAQTCLLCKSAEEEKWPSVLIFLALQGKLPSRLINQLYLVIHSATDFH